MSGNPILEVRNLRTAFDTDAGQVVAVDGVSFSVKPGSTLGLVGESGCGKSVTAFSIMRLLPHPTSHILDGEILYKGRDLLQLSESELKKIRGNEIGMIFQEPMAALNPVHRMGKQISEVLLLHKRISRREAMEQSVELMRRVGIPSPEARISSFPHQLSGGMRQRVVIAMALACNPSLVIADEPTTALDVTIQAQILDLMKDLQREMGMSIIMITHDLGVIAEMCDDVVVMYAGRVVEKGSVEAIFERPAHLYTKGLLESIPRLDHSRKTKLKTIRGMVPGLRDLTAGARFAPRSPHPGAEAYVQSEAFQSIRPELIQIDPGHWVEDCEVVRAR